MEFTILAKNKASFLVFLPAIYEMPPCDCEFLIPGEVASKVVTVVQVFWGGTETCSEFLNAPSELL